MYRNTQGFLHFEGFAVEGVGGRGNSIMSQPSLLVHFMEPLLKNLETPKNP